MIGGDVIDVLTQDHREIESMLDALRRAEQREHLVGVLVASLVRHAIAEEEYIYPVVRDQVPDGDRIADRGLSQHAQVEETMQQISETGTTGTAFSRLLDALTREVRRHVLHDERDLFPRLRRACTTSDLMWLGERVARATVPRLTRVSHAARDAMIDQVRALLSARRADAGE